MTLTEGTSTSDTHTSTLTGFNTTAQNSNMGLALPGFLQCKSGLDFREGKEIASGGFGVVLLGELMNPAILSDNREVAIKKIKGETLSSNHLVAFHQEISLMYFFKDCRYIAKIVGYSEDPYCLLMKYYRLGNLEDWIRLSSRRKTKNMILAFCDDISRGLNALHSHGFSHSDLKPQNILLDMDGMTNAVYCVLSDFGISQVVSDQSLLVQAFELSKLKGFSYEYASPDILMRLNQKNQRLDPSVSIYLPSDIYAYGIVMFFLVTRSSPWK